MEIKPLQGITAWSNKGRAADSKDNTLQAKEKFSSMLIRTCNRINNAKKKQPWQLEISCQGCFFVRVCFRCQSHHLHANALRLRIGHRLRP